MTPKTNQHGGARRGAGRPRNYRSDSVSVGFRLPVEFVAILDSLGKRSRAEALREALGKPALIRRLRKTF